MPFRPLAGPELAPSQVGAELHSRNVDEGLEGQAESSAGDITHKELQWVDLGLGRAKPGVSCIQPAPHQPWTCLGGEVSVASESGAAVLFPQTSRGCRCWVNVHVEWWGRAGCCPNGWAWGLPTPLSLACRWPFSPHTPAVVCSVYAPTPYFSLNSLSSPFISSPSPLFPTLPHCLPLLTSLPFLSPPYSFPWSGLFYWATRSQLGPPCNAQQMLGHWAPPTPFHLDTSLC